MPSQKVAEMIKCLKKRILGVSGKTSSRINRSSVLLNLKRAAQSAPDLLKMKTDPSQNGSAPDLSELATSDLNPMKSDEAFLTLSTVVDSIRDSSFPNFPKKSFSQGSKPVSTTTTILFSPSKEGLTSGSGKKLKLKFAMRKNNLTSTELPGGRAVTCTLPMITLTVPDDEQTYMLHRPTPPISFDSFLAVPTRSCPIKNTAEFQKISHKRWPHPAGPWLRFANFEESGFKIESDEFNWSQGWRLGTGRVIGWDPESIEALGISLPPQLPTEKDLQTLALVEQISMSLDQAQHALYGDMDGDWEADMDEDDYKSKLLAPSWMFPSCIEVLEGV